MSTPEGSDEEPAMPPRPPWHFWLLLAALVLYLGWRVIQGVAWMIERV